MINQRIVIQLPPSVFPLRRLPPVFCGRIALSSVANVAERTPENVRRVILPLARDSTASALERELTRRNLYRKLPLADLVSESIHYLPYLNESWLELELLCLEIHNVSCTLARSFWLIPSDILPLNK
ncbi:hypothetical protein PRIPAC_84160 [Pristionchus pacificus]|uniref:Uncharacterized protein n=1 Tax=Pristionchus pacificus TaxID=54126 RepID=A0A2A6CJ30_PRIPA|nr:hypothetical protein PRIPAC_84160 [Pristionchus pacificus]|eukprot:PDM78021.1 hypothetical protein PRIPAC_35210 [Pristionchus pacificus]